MHISHSPERSVGKWGARFHRAGAVLLASLAAAAVGTWAWSHVATLAPGAPTITFMDVVTVVAAVVALAVVVAVIFRGALRP
jgi:hypothetical protein